MNPRVCLHVASTKSVVITLLLYWAALHNRETACGGCVGECNTHTEQKDPRLSGSVTSGRIAKLHIFVSVLFSPSPCRCIHLFSFLYIQKYLVSILHMHVNREAQCQCTYKKEKKRLVFHFTAPLLLIYLPLLPLLTHWDSLCRSKRNANPVWKFSQSYCRNLHHLTQIPAKCRGHCYSHMYWQHTVVFTQITSTPQYAVHITFLLLAADYKEFGLTQTDKVRRQGLLSLSA